MSIRSKKRLIRRKFIHRKLKRRLLIFIIMFTIMSGIMIYDLLTHQINFWLALLAFGAGNLTGYIFGSISKIKWHPEDSVVIAKMDKIGIIILVVYLSFSLSRKWIFGHWIHGETLPAFSFSFAAGVILGRFISTRIKIRTILKEQGRLFKP